LPCVVKKRTSKIVYRALSRAAHGKGASPCKMLPCAPTKNARQRVCRAFLGLCRALGAHGKAPVSRSGNGRI
jgi:hypothetical protein